MKSVWNKGTAKKMMKKDEKLVYPNPKLKSIKDSKPKKWNKKGQMMMIGILILIMGLLIFIATLPAVQSVIDDAKGCSYLNCAGFRDSSATGADCGGSNQTYTPAEDTNALACTVLDLAIPFLILAVLAGLVMKLVQGRMIEQPDYSQGY